MFKLTTNRDFDKQCMIQKVCGKVEYSKVVTSGNDPSITKRKLYSQYVTSKKPHIVRSAPIQYINVLNLFIEQFAFTNNIDMTGSDIEMQTANFLIGKSTAQSYFELLRSIFSNNLNYDYLPDVLNGMYPLMPNDKGFYLKRYADLIVPTGSVYPHGRTQKPLVTNINFLYHF
jgi:hypothetical protein